LQVFRYAMMSFVVDVFSGLTSFDLGSL